MKTKQKRRLGLKVEKLKIELNEVKKEKKELEGVMRLVFSAKTFKAWQFYCHARDYLFKKNKVLINIKKIIKKILGKNNIKTRNCTIFIPKNNITTSINEKVSVIVPTYNAGKDFKKNLLSIKKQKKISNMEIVIVDNYSEDQTVKTALSLGCIIQKIKKFSHSRSRNLGTKSATGDYLIFTVQDAFFADPYSFCKLINFMKINKLAAASGCQTPYKNADNFAKWQFKNHYDFMNPAKQSIIYHGAKFAQELYSFDFFTRRKLMIVDDVFSCFNTTIFRKYYFSETILFAEDAQLALKLLQDGYNIGLAIFSKVYHSHNRDFIYHFKRSFCDMISLNLILKGSSHRIDNYYLENIYMIFNLMILLELNINYKKNIWDNIRKQIQNPLTENQCQLSSFYRYFYKILKEMNFQNKQYLNEYYFNFFKNEISAHSKFYYKYLNKNNYLSKKDDLLKVSAVILGSYLGEITSKISDERLKKTLYFLTHSV